MKPGFNIKSKLPETGLSIFAVMSKMASESGAINLSQGFPDFNCSEELIDLVNHFMKKGFNQYAPMPGTIELRKEISLKVQREYDKHYLPETEITVTAGATQALYTAISVIINPGDEVIIFEPAYDSYIPAIRINGGIPVPIKLNTQDFSIPWNEVEKAITDKTKCLIFNSPHNPSGSILKRSDIEMAEKILQDKNIFVISDEVYEHIVFDNYTHISFYSSDKLSNKSFVISSFGKTFHTTGWKIGYCCAPEYLMNEFRKVHQFIVFTVNTPVQLAISEFLKNENNIKNVSNFYQNKRDIFRDLIRQSNFKIRNCNGTYFQLLDYSDISDKNDLEFAEYLTRDVGVAVIPLSPFYTDSESGKLIRVCFAKQEIVLRDAATKLSRL